MSVAVLEEAVVTVRNRVSAVVLAGGQGTRFGAAKPFVSLCGRPVIDWALDTLQDCCDEIIVVAEQPWRHWLWAPAGATRSESARNGVQAATGEKLIIHDAARPFIDDQVLTSVIALLDWFPVVTPAVPVTDGLQQYSTPVRRDGFMLRQTPQGFQRVTLVEAFNRAGSWDDEVSRVHGTLGITPFLIAGSPVNTKLTVASDLALAEGMARMRHRPETTARPVTGRVLVLGGSGGIGTAVCNRLDNLHAPTVDELDLSSGFNIDLSEYEAIVHAAGEYENTGKIMPVNFQSVVRLCRLAEEQGWQGRIVVVSSATATWGRPKLPLYSASKAALNTWIEAEHDRLANRGIILNAVAPGKVHTRLQTVVNPDADPTLMLTPRQVAERIIPYLTTSRHGVIDYMRVGL